MQVEDKVAIVTGAARGIGLATARLLLEEGAQYVAVLDHFREDEAQVTEALRELGSSFDAATFGYYRCDVTNAEQLEASYKKILRLKGYVDILVNNAGTVDENNCDLTIDVNFKAVVKGTLIAIENMSTKKGHKGGVVVNIASFLGLVNSPMCPVYNATKHAVVSYVRSMKEHNEKLGVRIVCVCPGMTMTNMITFDNLRRCSLELVTDDQIEKLLSIYLQKPDNIAFAVLEIIKKGKGGDVWLAKDDKPPFNVGEQEDLDKMQIPF